nr:60S acidic ribosomal protein P1 [Cryptomonas sp.]
MWQLDNKSEVSCILASFILNENNIEISDQKIVALLSSAEVKFESYWPRTFVRLSQNFDFGELTGYKKDFKNAEAQQNFPDSKKLEKSEEKMESLPSSKGSEDGDMGFGLFD